MKARSFIGSYLAKEDLDGDVIATISSANEELFEGDARPKLILNFEELDRGLVCNVTNINALVELFGTDETDDWTGKKVTLYVDPNVMFAGKRIGGIRVKSASPESN